MHIIVILYEINFIFNIKWTLINISISIYHYIAISLYHYINISIYQYINISILSYAINMGIFIELFYSFSMHTFQWLIQNIIECLWILATYFKFSVLRMMTHPQMMNWRHDAGPPPLKRMTHHCPISMGDKWALCFDTGSINVHDSWASEWWLILRWCMGVMSRHQLV